ncbi:MAG: N-acetyltransferase [Chloroflexi bacterium CFX7]|nr:MAG: N-acetyltransferase [bacterium]MCE7927181.1 N-acetyltransferase [Chloroflexi bacterium CFX7]MCL4230111.1 GNAT family N-acetyltransferase [Dehalococcoidia bacterium]
MSGQALDDLVVATTARLRLRHKHESDAMADFLWRRDPEIARFDGGLPLTKTFSEFLEYFDRLLRLADPERQMLSLENAEGLHIGNIMFYNADSARHAAELGICIARPEYRGAGLGTEAVVAFLGYIWERLPFRLMYLHTLDWNAPAIHCFEKAGFSTTARVLRKGQWFLRMEVRREWWLLWDQEGRFARYRGTCPAGASPGALPLEGPVQGAENGTAACRSPI